MYKHYTKEFKNEIIQRYLNKESVRNLSLETQVSKATIYQWLSNYQKEQTLPKKIANRTIEEQKSKIKKLETMLTIINEIGLSPLAPLKEKLYAMEPFYKKYSSIIKDEVALGYFKFRVGEQLNSKRGRYVSYKYSYG